mgnify:CR=1 FL=1
MVPTDKGTLVARAVAEEVNHQVHMLAQLPNDTEDERVIWDSCCSERRTCQEFFNDKYLWSHIPIPAKLKFHLEQYKTASGGKRREGRG